MITPLTPATAALEFPDEPDYAPTGLDNAERLAAAHQVLVHAADAGITDVDLAAATAEIEDLKISAALWKEWAHGRITVGWNGAALTYYANDEPHRRRTHLRRGTPPR
jgi:hypothetical protein